MDTHVRYLRRKEVSAYLRQKFGLERSPATLAKLAVIGGGPPFRRMGRTPLYSEVDIDRWVAERIGPLIHSTSDRTGDVVAISDGLERRPS
jgi:hypothetical protein